MSILNRATSALVLLATLFVPAAAGAAMMEHYDLAGLVMQSDSIVVAQRTASHEGTSRYQVTRVLRGPLKADAQIEVYDSLYVTTGRSIDPGVFLFLKRDSDGKPYLVSSGMRVTEQGRVFRFEQHSNPGGFAMVPQGRDPEDNWQAGVTAVEVPSFERALAAATKRVDDLAAAQSQSDATKRRAAMLALLPPPGTRAPVSGFYSDALVHAVEAALADAGDLEGALLASLRDRSPPDRPGAFGKLPDLVASAQDPARPLDVRIAAVAAIEGHLDFFGSAVAVRALNALLADPAARLRSAAAFALAHVSDWSSSDSKEQAQVTRLARETRASLEARFVVEQDNGALFALAAAFRDRALPARRGGPPVAVRGHVERSYVNVEVRCLQAGHRFADGKVTAILNGATAPIPGFNVSYSCGHDGEGSATSAPDAPLPAGSYQVAVEMKIDKKPVTLPLGMLVSDGNGEMTLSQ
jgi:hypothetical protein